MRLSFRKVFQIVFLTGCTILGLLMYAVSYQNAHDTYNRGKNGNNKPSKNGDVDNSIEGGDLYGAINRFLNYQGKDYQIQGKISRYLHNISLMSHLRGTELKDIFISVKTSGQFHDTRVPLILDTWFNIARQVTYFFTDVNDETLYQKTGGHVINTNCSSVHNRNALCCKMSVEFDYFMASGKRWLCHMDDDTYLHAARLLKLLQGFNHTGDWYLGKPSLNHPMQIRKTRDVANDTKVSFWFATGGAGFCLSRGLALKMMPYAGGGRLKTMCDKIRLPDDCTVGYIVYENLHKKLKVIPELHSHLEGLYRIKDHNIHDQITLSYGQFNQRMNRVHIQGFNETYDPTRFYSIHCKLYPNAGICMR